MLLTWNGSDFHLECHDKLSLELTLRGPSQEAPGPSHTHLAFLLEARNEVTPQEAVSGPAGAFHRQHKLSAIPIPVFTCTIRGAAITKPVTRSMGGLRIPGQSKTRAAPFQGAPL